MALQLLSATTLNGTEVRNPKGEHLGRIEDMMIDLDAGCIAYAVLSFGGVMGIGDKLFAIPWHALRVDTVDEKIIVDIARETLRNAPGFDKNDWPDMSDRDWGLEVYSYYNEEPYWEK